MADTTFKTVIPGLMAVDLNQVVDGAAEKDDELTASIEFKGDDEVIWKRESMPLLVGRDEVLGVKVETLPEELTGAKVDDVKTIEATLPDTFPIEEHRGKDVSMVIEVKEVKRPDLPEATDEWASDMGFDSLDELKEELNKQISKTKEQEAREGMKRQIRDQLAAMVPMDLPEDLVTRVAKENVERRRMLLAYQGLSEEEVEEKMGEQDDESSEDTEKNVKLYFIFDQVATEEKIFVTEDELRVRTDQLAANYSVEPDRYWEIMDSEGRLDSLRKDMLDEKIVDLLISKASVKEAAPAEQKPDEDSEKAPEEGKTAESKQYDR